jgi:mono/diheme cytochrome c family protein
VGYVDAPAIVLFEASHTARAIGGAGRHNGGAGGLGCGVGVAQLSLLSARMAWRVVLGIGFVLGLGGLLLLEVGSVDAASSAKLAARGRAVLQDNCGRCHAIDSNGDSPMKAAPPMREVYSRFAPRELQAELSEGMVSHFKDMPQIDFTSEDVDAILTYLYQLSVRQWRASHPRTKSGK